MEHNHIALDRYLDEQDADAALDEAALKLMGETLDAHDAGTIYWAEPELVADLRAAVEAEESQDWAREQVIENEQDHRY